MRESIWNGEGTSEPLANTASNCTDWCPSGTWRIDSDSLSAIAQELHVTSLQQWIDLSA